MSKCIIALSLFVTLFCLIILPITSKAAPVLASVDFNSLPGHTLPTGLVPNTKKVLLDHCTAAQGVLKSTMVGIEKTICPAGYVAIENDLVGLQAGGFGGSVTYLRCCQANLVWIN